MAGVPCICKVCRNHSHYAIAMVLPDLSIYELSLLPILLLAPIFILLKIRRGTSSKGEIPPSPLGLPIIGNLHQLGSFPHRSLAELAKKHGPIMLLRLGRVRTLVVTSADAAREIMKTHDLVFASRPSSKVAQVMLYGAKDLVFSPYSEYWRWMRKICTTHLLSNKMVQSFQRMREEEVAIMIEKVSSGGGAVDMSEVLSSLSNDIVCRAVSGKFSMEAGRNRLFRETLEENNYLLGAFHVEDFLPFLGWLDGVFFGLNARAEMNRKRWDRLLDEAIRLQADRGMADDHDIQEGGFVEVMLSLQNEQGKDFTLNKDNIKALLVDMFAAGTDTTYHLLEWTMAELVQNPKAMKKLQDEVRGVAKEKPMVRGEDLSELRYLRAVIMESLRLHPPIPLLVPRESMEDCEIHGYKVPKKTRVIVNSWAIGRDPKAWDEPNEFRPERFIDSSIDFRGNDFNFIPFGAGRRICPGMNFSMATSELALANLMRRFDWELLNGMAREDFMAESPGISPHKKESLVLLAKTYAC